MTTEARAGERLGQRGELLVVLAVALIVPLLMSAYGLAVSRQDGGRVAFGDASILVTLLYEAVVGLVLVSWLVRRGWTLADVALPFESRDLVRGAGIFIVALLAYYVTYFAIAWVAPEFVEGGSMRAEGRVSVPVAILAVVLNSLFEEFLWLGYIMTAATRIRGLVFASCLSAVLRVALHSYQGATAITGVLPVAILFTWYFATTRRVWPVVVAHMIQNTLAFTVLLSR